MLLRVSSLYTIAISVAILSAAQEPTPSPSPEFAAVSVCVALPVNVPPGNLNPEGERDRVIRNIEQLQGKQPPVFIRPLPLTASDAKHSLTEAREQRCEYVVVSTIAVNTAASSTIGTKGGVQSSVRVPAGIHPTPDVNAQYSILQVDDGSLFAKGSVIAGGGIEANDVSSVLQNALHDLAGRVVKEVANRKAPTVQ